ncbi:hypothetical protein Agub_g1007, partial [Astrephomene gubernaculifera]
MNRSCLTRSYSLPAGPALRAAVPATPVRLLPATRASVATAAYADTVLEDCVDAHFSVEELGHVPQGVSKAWGAAWDERLKESRGAVTLRISEKEGSPTCELILVGIFHRDAANLRFIREAIETAEPDAVALEARHSFLPTYRHLLDAVPEDLLLKLLNCPLHDLQEAFSYITIEDRLAWHIALLDANQQLGSLAPLPSSPSSLLSCTSSLRPSQVVGAFLARELVLSDKLGAAWAAAAAGDLPLHGIELDDPASYQQLLRGPLTASGTCSSSDSGSSVRTCPGSPGGPQEWRPPQAASPQAGGPPQEQEQEQDAALLRWLEGEQRRLALGCLGGRLAGEVGEWMQRAPTGDMQRLLQVQLAGLLPHCMGPTTYAAYVDATEALWQQAGGRSSGE